MQFQYQTRGTCARGITFELEDGKVKNVRFEGGCSGNTQGVARLVEGLTVEQVQETAADSKVHPAPISLQKRSLRRQNRFPKAKSYRFSIFFEEKACIFLIICYNGVVPSL